MVTIKGSTGRASDAKRTGTIRVVHVDKPVKKAAKPLTTGQALTQAMQQIGESKPKAVTPNVNALVLLTDRLQTLNLDIAAQSAALQRNDLYSESRSLLNIAIRMAADLEHMLLILGQERAGIIDDVLETASIELVSSYNQDADDEEEDDLDEDEDDFEDDTDHNDDEDEDEDSDGLDDGEAEAVARANAAEFGVSVSDTQSPERTQDPNADAAEDDSDDDADTDDN